MTINKEPRMKMVNTYILMMKTGEYADFHEKSMLVHPVDEFRSACIHDDKDEMAKWLEMNPKNKDLAEIWYLSAMAFDPASLEGLDEK